MNSAGFAVEAPFLKDITLAAITEFLKKRTDYLFNIGKVNESLDDDSKIIPTYLVASVDNELLATLDGGFGFPLGRHCDTDAERRLGLGFLGAETRTSGISQWNFLRSQKHWSVIEKEAFRIVEAVERLRHLLLRDEGIRLFTDHRNLIYVFDPILRDKDFKKQAVDKLWR